MNSKDRNKIIAIIAAVLLHVAMILFLVYSHLYYSWPPENMPQPTENEILFGGEYVMLGDMQQPANDDLAAKSSDATSNEDAAMADDDMKNSGTPGETPELISSERESEMVVKKSEEKPKKTGPSKEELAEQERVKREEERQKREQEKADKISRRVSFNSSGSGSGKTGTPNGSATGATTVGAPGFSMQGRTLESWGKPKSSVDGRIVIEVRINAKGRVISARYKSGTGSAAANAAARESCKNASLSSRFSVATSTTAEQVGTITWRFE